LYSTAPWANRRAASATEIGIAQTGPQLVASGGTVRSHPTLPPRLDLWENAMPTGSVHPGPHTAAHMATAGLNPNLAGGGRGTVGPQYQNIDICRVLMAA